MFGWKQTRAALRDLRKDRRALQYMSSVSSKPADYLQVAVTFSYSPLFQGISVAGLFATPITKTAMVRML